MEARGDRDDIVMLSKSSSETELPEENGIIDVENDASAKIERTEATSSANAVADKLAADDIRNFIGQPWTNWEAAMCRSPLFPEVPSKVYESDCTTLSFEDKRWAGEIPGIEPFIVHVCILCKASVKPGFLTQHYALWHNVKPDDPLPDFEELKKDPLNTTLRTHRISPDCKLILGLPKVKIKKQKQAKSASNTQNVIGGGNTGILPSPKAGPAVISASSTNKSTNKTFSNSLDVRQETVPNISVSLPLALPLSVPMKPVVTDSSLTKLTKTSKITTSSIDLGVFLPTLPVSRAAAASDPPVVSVVPVPVATHVSALSQPLASPPPKKRSKTERKYLPVKDREYNPDKHCGVWNLETSKHCTRSLTCNCHSLSQRRAVTGRSKTFDNLLADHRAAKETLLLAAKPNVIQVTQQEKQGKCPASIPKSSSLLKQDVLPTHNFHVVTSGSAVTSVLSHRQKPTALPSLYFPPSSSQLLSVNALERTIKSLTPAVIGQVTVAKFPPCKSDSAELTGKTDTVLRTKIDHLPADISWVKRHPKPVAVCSFSAHKVGTVLSHSKQMAVARRILRTTLIRGLIEVPLASNTYAAPLQVNHTAANSSSKGNLLGGSNMVLITNITPKSTKVALSCSSSNNKNVKSLSLTTVGPKITSVKASSSESALKNVQQFHMSTVLTPCSKQNDIVQHKKKGQVSRVKRSHSSGSVEVVGSVLSQRHSAKSRANHMPLMTLSISNGVSTTTSGHIKMGEQKVVFVPQGTQVSDRFFSKIPKSISSNIAIAAPDATQVSTKLTGDLESRHRRRR